MALLAVLAIGLSACGSTTSSSSNGSGSAQGTSSQPATSFAKTKFVLHAGLAFGAFHHFIYKPLRAGNLTSGGLGTHKLALLKAGLAGLFAYHEVKLALVDAQSSPLLSRLVSPLTALQAKFQALGATLKGGSVDSAAIQDSNASVASASAAAKASGQPVSDITPTAGQLAGG